MRKLPKINQKYVIIGSGIVAVGVITYIIVHRIQANKIYAQLVSDLQTGTGATGTINDLTVSGQALDPNYYTGSSDNLLSDSQVQTDIANLKSWIGSTYWFSNKQSILDLFKSLANKAQVSQLADAYYKAYGVAMLDDLKTIDYTLFSWDYGTAYLPQIKAIIDALPN